MTLERQLERYGGYLDELFEEATTPDAIGVATFRPARRRTALLTAAVLLPVALIAGLLTLARDEPAVVRADSGVPVGFIPPTNPEGMRLLHASDGVFEDPRGFAVYGPAGQAEPSNEVVAVEVTPAGSNNYSNGGEAHTVAIGDIEALVSTGRSGSTVVEWQAGELNFRVHTAASSLDDSVEAFIEGITVDPKMAIEATVLPDGWDELWDTAEASGTFTRSYYSLFDDAGMRFDVTTWSGAPAGALWGMHFPIGAGKFQVRDHVGFADTTDLQNPFLWWQEDDGLTVLVQNSGGDLGTLHRFATELRPAREKAWSEFAAGAVGEEHAIATTTMPRSPIPAVVGTTVAEATETLTAAGFQASVHEGDSAHPDGTVVAQEPGPDTEASASSVVGLRTAAPVPAQRQQCPAAIHPRYGGPTSSGDGLPPDGATALPTVRRAADQQRRELLDRYESAINVYVAHRDGDVWIRDGEGEISIERRADYQLVLELTDPDDCPDMPQYPGVPLTFVVTR